MSRSCWIFHFLLILSIKVLTFRFTSNVTFFLQGSLIPTPGSSIHLSSQIQVLSQFPTCPFNPLCNKSLPNKCSSTQRMVSLPWELPRSQECGNYRLFKNMDSKHSDWLMIFHPFLANRAWLKLSISLKPILPRALGRHILSHDTQWIFLICYVSLHQ